MATEKSPERIYLSPPHLTGLEREFVLDALASNWVAPVGPHLDAFEREFGTTIGCAHAAAVSSCTAALHLALRLAGVGPGDEVLVSTLTFVASASPVLFLGARPVLIDSERDSWNMDPALLAQTLEARAKRGRLPKAVVAVHLYGQCADLAAIRNVCAYFQVALVEDAAEALGAQYQGRAAGTFGLFGAFSFNGNKMITTSGGGMLVSADASLIERARFLSMQARDPAPHYQHSELGYNYRLSNILAAIGRAQLRSLDARVAARRRISRIYHHALGDLPGVDFQPEASSSLHARWLTCLTINPSRAPLDRDDLLHALELENIEARPVWKPLHLQPLFAGCTAVGGQVAEELFEQGLCLPSGSSMTDDDLARVIAAIRKAFLHARLPIWPGVELPTPTFELLASGPVK